jgi:hypothetical protein
MKYIWKNTSKIPKVFTVMPGQLLEFDDRTMTLERATEINETLKATSKPGDWEFYYGYDHPKS